MLKNYKKIAFLGLLVGTLINPTISLCGISDWLKNKSTKLSLEEKRKRRISRKIKYEKKTKKRDDIFLLIFFQGINLIKSTMSSCETLCNTLLDCFTTRQKLLNNLYRSHAEITEQIETYNSFNICCKKNALNLKEKNRKIIFENSLKNKSSKKKTEFFSKQYTQCKKIHETYIIEKTSRHHCKNILLKHSKLAGCEEIFKKVAEEYYKKSDTLKKDDSSKDSVI